VFPLPPVYTGASGLTIEAIQSRIIGKRNPFFSMAPRVCAETHKKRSERRTKDAVHSAFTVPFTSAVNGSLLGALRLHMTRRLILHTGKTQNGAGERRGATSLPRKTWRSLQPGEQWKSLFQCVFARIQLGQSEGRKTKEGEHMSIINKPPEMVKREYELQEPIAVAVEKYAAFIASTPDHVANSALKMALWRDADFGRCRKQHRRVIARSGRDGCQRNRLFRSQLGKFEP
jgi:hypothetical protein